MSSFFDVSIVIITWEMRDFLNRCLESILQFTNELKYEIIVIDNNSLDGTSELVTIKFPDVKLVINNENKGVAPARNQGIKLAKGRYVLILDADMELIENSLFPLFQYMEKNKECGVIGAKLIGSNGTLQFSCKRFPNLIALLFRRLDGIKLISNSSTLKYHTMMDWDHSDVKEVDYLIGACQLIRKNVLDKIGFYDEKIFYGPEDIDFCLRVWKAGWKVIYFPHTKIIHYEQRITKRKLFTRVSFKHLLGILYIYKKYNGKLKISNKSH